MWLEYGCEEEGGRRRERATTLHPTVGGDASRSDPENNRLLPARSQPRWPTLLRGIYYGRY